MHSLLLALLIQAPVPGADACQPGAVALRADGWKAVCLDAIAAEHDAQAKATLLNHKAYAHNELGDFESAQAALRQAVELQPDLANAWHELGYTENALGNYAEGEAAIDRELVLRGETSEAHSERAFARIRRGDFAGNYADRDRQVALGPQSAGARTARAEAAMWLGRFDQARSDLDAADGLAATEGDRTYAQSVRKALVGWTTRSPATDPAASCRSMFEGKPITEAILLGDCTAAFLAASTASDKAEFLTNRSAAWLGVEQNKGGMVLDRTIAVALEPGNSDRHANLGFALLQARHSWAARREFDRALAIKPKAFVLAGRAAASYNLHDSEAAFADAKRSFEMEPNVLALIVLGDVSKDRGDPKSAKLYWMGAYHMDARADETRERLKSIGVDHPEREPAPK